MVFNVLNDEKNSCFFNSGRWQTPSFIVVFLLPIFVSYSGLKVYSDPQDSWARIFRRLFSRCTYVSKRGTKSLVRRYQAKFAKTVLKHLKVCHIWLIKKKKTLCLVIFLFTYYAIHIFVPNSWKISLRESAYQENGCKVYTLDNNLESLLIRNFIHMR